MLIALFVSCLQSHRPTKQPWSPRYTMERALVNILETTSSFSFKAAALLEGKPFTWQDSLNPGASANLGTAAGSVRTAAPGAAAGTAGAAAAGAGTGLGVRTAAAAAAGRQAQRQRGGRGGRSGSSRQQRPDVSDSVGSMSPASAASTGDVAAGASSSHSAAAAASRLGATSRGPAQQQQQQAWLPAGDRQMQKEPSFRAGVLPAAGAGAGGSNSGSSCSSSGRLAAKVPRHQRSRSLSSIQSGDGGSLRDGDDEDTVPADLPQQQQEEELSVPSLPPVTSPFARVSHMQQHGAALERCGFGSTISLHAGTPPSSHRWNQQQHLRWQQAQVQAQAHASEASSTSSRGQGGPGSGGSPATTATPTSAAGAGASFFPGAAAAAAAGSASAAGAAGGAGTAAAGVSKVVAAAVQPPFLDMVPWYSGTSADLFKTMFDLLISVKLFLGRFDMRTMQVGGCFEVVIFTAGVVVFWAVGRRRGRRRAAPAGSYDSCGCSKAVEAHETGEAAAESAAGRAVENVIGAAWMTRLFCPGASLAAASCATHGQGSIHSGPAPLHRWKSFWTSDCRTSPTYKEVQDRTVAREQRKQQKHLPGAQTALSGVRASSL